MSSNVTMDGVSYTIPATGDQGWSDNLTAYLIAITSSMNNRLKITNNLSDLGNTATARTNLGADNASNLTNGTVLYSLLPVGTTINTVAAGNDSRLTTVSNLANRNVLINGDMAIDQRNAGASQTFTAGTALAYCVDRWWGACTGANVTGQQTAITGWSDARKYAYQFTGLASNTGVQFGQRIEMLNSFHLANKNLVLSAYMKASTNKTVTWIAYYATANDDFTSKTQIATGTWSVTTTATRFTATLTGPTEANSKGIEIVFSVPTLLGSETWALLEFN